MSIAEFTFKGKPVYINSDAIVGILAPLDVPSKAMLYCEEPLGCLMVDQTVDQAFALWYAAVEDIEEGEADE